MSTSLGAVVSTARRRSAVRRSCRFGSVSALRRRS